MQCSQTIRRLTLTELITFVCGPEMTSCRFLRQVASQVNDQCGFRRAVPDFLFAINYNFWSISYRFRVISICSWTGNDVMPVSPLGGILGQMSMRIMKGSYMLPHCGGSSSEPISTKFGRSMQVPNLVTPANFGFRRSMGFVYRVVQKQGRLIETAGDHYNRAAMPCSL